MEENIRDYLKIVSELESSVYGQQQCIECAESKIKEPVRKQYSISAPSRPQRVGKQVASPLPGFGILFLGLYLYCMIMFLRDHMFMAFAILTGPLAVWGLVKCIIKMVKGFKETKELNEGWENAYQSMIEIYNHKMEAYNNSKEIWEKKEEARIQHVRQSNSNALTEVGKMKSTLSETESVLSNMYGKDIIFEKYRNMVAMCTMYEYFESGRCTELKGPNGAYNLYESELRQNLIINKLDSINQNLEQIKDNQYVLYTELKKTNSMVDDIMKDVSRIQNSTEVISEFSKIDAYCSMITARNAMYRK